MESEKNIIVSRVMSAKNDNSKADALIEDYMPFIKSETAKFLKRSPDKSDDELSIAMFAFYEAVCSYSLLKGSFLKFASLLIKNRLIDYYRREKRSRGHISLDSSSDEQTDLTETISDSRNDYEEIENREAAKQEINELNEQMKDFGISMNDIADNSPKQERTLRSCQAAVYYAKENPEILQEFLRTKRIPLAKLSEGADVERKTLERHRKYLAAVLLICTNGYEILREHIAQVLKRG